MGHIQKYIGHIANTSGKYDHRTDIVLEKSIFSNVFEKDIRRVFVYKKIERIVKALNLIAPAFVGNGALKDRIDTLALRLLDTARLSTREIRSKLPQEVLALSSLLSVARTARMLSPMNTEIIMHEAQELLKEVEGHEDTALILEDVPTISTLAKKSFTKETKRSHLRAQKQEAGDKGHIKDIVAQLDGNNDRKGAIISLIKSKGRANIKDISMIVQGVSEKTIQREITALVESGVVVKTGERRWSTYSLS